MTAESPARPPRLSGRRTARADVLLRGGRVFRTVGRPFATAVAISGGTVLAAGSDRECAGLADSETFVIDLEGRTVVPGLIDGHIHAVRAGLTWEDELRWDEVASLAEALATLSTAASRRPAGTWLAVVGGWHHGQFAEGREPTREDLDRAAPDHPVFVQLLYERAQLNSAGIAALGLDRHTPDPEGGRWYRDERGLPTGGMEGVGAFNHVLARIPARDRAAAASSTRHLLEDLAAYGLTGVIDPGGLGVHPGAYDPLFALWHAGALPLRVRLFVCPATRGAEEQEIAAWLDHQASGFGDEWLRLVGVGEIAVFGCHDLEGLRPHTITQEDRAALERVATRVAERGWPLHLHAVLDDTISAVLDVWEKIDARIPLAPLRWSLAHAEAISRANIERVQALGLAVGVQDRLVYRAADSAAAWGAETAAGGPPLRTLWDAGIVLGGGTDAMRVASPNPWVSLWWLITGKSVDGGPRRIATQRLTREEALHAYTAGSAWFSFEEDVRGALLPGAAADLAVLSDDYFTVNEDRIASLRSELTLVDGRPVHADGPFAALAREAPAPAQG